jgi:hypothetical protein
VRRLASTAPYYLHVTAAIEGDYESFGEISFASSIENENKKNVKVPSNMLPLSLVAHDAFHLLE